MELIPVKRERAIDAVHQALRDAILNSLLRPGERLNVEELAQKLGVSLTPVRHAIQMLTTEGLVEVRPRSGTYVASVSARDVEETFDIRCALECMAASQAVPRVTQEDLQHLRELLKLLKQPVHTQEESRAHQQANSEFHLVILRAAGNRRLLEMYDSLNAHIKIARIHASGTDWQSRLDLEQAEHEEIVDALEQRAATRLVKAMRAHIMRARDSLVAALPKETGA